MSVELQAMVYYFEYMASSFFFKSASGFNAISLCLQVCVFMNLKCDQKQPKHNTQKSVPVKNPR